MERTNEAKKTSCYVDGCDGSTHAEGFHPRTQEERDAELYAEFPQLEPRGRRERKPRMTRAESRARTIANNRRLDALAASLAKVVGK